MALGRAKLFLQFSAQHSGDSDDDDAGDNENAVDDDDFLSDDDDYDCDNDDEEHPLQLVDVGQVWNRSPLL